METNLQTVTREKISSSLSPVHLLLAVQSLDVLLVSINRLGSLTQGYVAPNEFLRWVDFHNMLTLPLISLVAFFLLKKQLEKNPAATRRGHLALDLAFLVGVYLLGASYGDHEVTNYLHARFCPSAGGGFLCQIIVFNDDSFSHWLFFTGFVLVNASLLLLQAARPFRARLSALDGVFLILNGLFIGAGIFANLAFETIGLDLYVVAILAFLSIGLIWRRGVQPLFLYYSTAYSLGLVATFVYKTLSG